MENDSNNGPDKVVEQVDAMLSTEKTEPHRHHKTALVIAVVILLLVMAVAAWLLLTGKDDDTSSSAAQLATHADEQPAEQRQDSQTTAGSGLDLFESSYLLPSVAECEEAGTFVAVEMFDGPGAGYSDPETSVSCSGDEFMVTSNNMPLWEFIALTPNALEEQSFSWTVTRNPEIAAMPTQIGYQDASNSTLGDLGFTVSGLVWYGPTEGPQPDPYGDPFTNAILDDCGGHTGPSGEYHEHIIVTKCFFPDWTEDKPAPIVGYALDGFPIYGPTGRLSVDDESVVTFKSSYKETGSIAEYAWDNVEYVSGQGDEYLDECNGRIQPDGSYGYHLTQGFPYIIGCFKGTPTGVNTGGGAPAGQGPQGGQQGPPPQGGQGPPQ